MSWDPGQYLKFVDARRRPALDLLARLDGTTAGCVVDLGCGTGNITRLLAERWPTAQLTGVDSDPAMLAEAAVTHSGILWQCAEIATWRATRAPDVIFSNAALQWLSDHQQLFPTLLEQLVDGGTLAVQMPSNFGAASHRILRELAEEPRWLPLLGKVRMGSVLSAAEYQQLLAAHCRHLELWETTYWQVLQGDDAVFEWMKGTTMVPYLARLDAVATDDFLAAYRGRLRAAYPRHSDGYTLFPFQRIFLVARC